MKQLQSPQTRGRSAQERGGGVERGAIDSETGWSQSMRGSRRQMRQNEHPSVSWSPSLRTTSWFQALWKHREKSCKMRTTLNPLSALHLSERIWPPAMNTCRADAGSSCCEALDWQYQVSQQSQTSRLTRQVARNRQCQVVRCQQPGVVIRKWLPPPIVWLQTLCCQENRCNRIQPRQSLLPKEALADSLLFAKRLYRALLETPIVS